MSVYSLILLSALVAALSTPSFAGNVTFGKVYRSGEFVYDDRDFHAIVSPTQSRFRRSPCPEAVPVIDPLSIDLQLSGPPDYRSVRFMFDVSPKTIHKAECNQTHTKKSAGQWSQGSDLLMEFYHTAAAELGVMSAVLRNPPNYGLTIHTKTDPSKAVLTINDVKEGSRDVYVCTVHAGKCASVTTSFIISMPACNETTTTSTTSTSTTTTTTTRSTTTSSPSTTASTTVPSSTTTITTPPASTDPKTPPTTTTKPSTTTTRASTTVSTTDSRPTFTTHTPRTTSDGKTPKPVSKIEQEVQAKFRQARQAQQQANAALDKAVQDLENQGRKKDANDLRKKVPRCGCTC